MSVTTPGEGTGDNVEDLTARSLDERLNVLEGLVDELGATVLDLVGEAPDGTEEDRREAGYGRAGGGAGEDAGEGEAAPTGWAARANAEDWRNLAAWVDWLGATYDHQPSRAVLPCWPAHGGVVHELAALRSAWKTAATTDASDDPGDAMASWHESVLRPCLTRLREDYQIKACTDRHVAARPRRRTNTELLAAAIHNASARSVDSDELKVDRVTGELH